MHASFLTIRDWGGALSKLPMREFVAASSQGTRRVRSQKTGRWSPGFRQGLDSDGFEGRELEDGSLPTQGRGNR